MTRLCVPSLRWAGRSSPGVSCPLSQARVLELSMSLPISCSGLRGPPHGGERQDLRSEEGPLRNKLHGAVPVQPRLHPAPRAHNSVPAQWAVGGATDILHKPYVLGPFTFGLGLMAPLQLGEGAGNEGGIVLGCRLAPSQAEGDITVPLTC